MTAPPKTADSRLEAHEAAVARLLAQYRELPPGEPVRLAKSTTNLFRPRERTRRPGQARGDGERRHLRGGDVDPQAGRRPLVAPHGQPLPAEVAAAFVLLAGSALMVQSFRRLQTFDFGIEAERVLFVRPRLSANSYAPSARREAYFAEAVDRLRGR